MSLSKKSNGYPKLKEDDYYLNAAGLMVLTEKYHKRRGYCCEKGCLHCPYGFNSTKKTGKNK